MHQLIYVSSVAPASSGIDPAAILEVSRENNRRDGLTGLLYSDGRRFLQVLEGEAEQVDRTFARIEADRRHRAIVLLSHKEIDAREFGDWAMAHLLPGQDADRFVAQVSERVANASPDVRGFFEGFAQARRA